MIVTYFPDHDLFEQQIQVLVQSGVHIVVVDNGSDAEHVNHLVSVASRYPNVEIVELNRNQGIATAQNVGMARAIAHRVRYVLFLDHDSIPSENLVRDLCETAYGLQRRGIKLAAVGARLVDPRTGKENGFYRLSLWRWHRVRCGQSAQGAIVCEMLNSSGSLHPIEALREVGPFDESLFIDHVETDWFLRARRLGYQSYGCCRGNLSHYMGDSVVRYWFFGWRWMPRRSPQRHYYIVRNSLLFYRRNHVPLVWKLFNAVKLIFTFAYFSILDPERGEQRRMMLRGIADGIRGKTGELKAKSGDL